MCSSVKMSLDYYYFLMSGVEKNWEVTFDYFCCWKKYCRVTNEGEKEGTGTFLSLSCTRECCTAISQLSCYPALK